MAEATQARPISDREWADMWSKAGLRFGKRYGPFKLAVGTHYETDPIATEEAIRRQTEWVKSNPEEYERAMGRKWDGKVVCMTLDKDPKPIVVDRQYTHADPPFMSLSDLDKHNIKKDDGSYAFAPKFIKVGDAAEALGCDPELFKRPGESIGEFAARIAEMAKAEEAPAAQPVTQPKPQPQQNKR